MPKRSPVTPTAALIQRIEVICLRLVRGGIADKAWQVKCHLGLRIASIVMTSLGGAGFIADKVNKDLSGQAGWAFWGGMILLSFGILTQIANELGVERIATQARAATESFKLLTVRLDVILEEEDPTSSVSKLQIEVREAFQKYHAVIPAETPAHVMAGKAMASQLVQRHKPNWKLSS